MTYKVHCQSTVRNFLLVLSRHTVIINILFKEKYFFYRFNIVNLMNGLHHENQRYRIRIIIIFHTNSMLMNIFYAISNQISLLILLLLLLLFLCCFFLVHHSRYFKCAKFAIHFHMYTIHIHVNHMLVL